MLIYAISNPAQKYTNYVCDSQDTIDAAASNDNILTLTNPIFSIGNETDAQTISLENATNWFNQQVNSGLFSVNKEVPVDPSTLPADLAHLVANTNPVSLVKCDLSTEPDNNDVVYQLLNVPYGNHISVVGLSAAKTQMDQIQQQYMDFTGIKSYITLTSWPLKSISPVIPPPGFVPVSQRTGSTSTQGG